MIVQLGMPFCSPNCQVPYKLFDGGLPNLFSVLPSPKVSWRRRPILIAGAVSISWPPGGEWDGLGRVWGQEETLILRGKVGMGVEGPAADKLYI